MPPSGSIAPGLSPESTRGSSVARPSASTSHGPFSRSPLDASRLFIALVDVELLMSMRIGSPPVGNPAAIGFGVMRDCHAAVRRDAGGRRIGAHQHDDEAGIGHRLQIRLQTTDVVASTDDDRHDRVREDAVARLGDRLLHEPVSRTGGGRPT